VAFDEFDGPGIGLVWLDTSRLHCLFALMREHIFLS
jgi:hypothetical protein